MDERRPHQVYRVGEDPDARFTLANERTMLAWVRTALALIAAGVLVDAVDLPIADGPRRWLAAGLVLLGAVSAVGGWFRWARTERALRTGTPMPAPTLGAVIVGGLVAASALVLAVILLR